MKKMRLAVIGLGKLGRQCAAAVLIDQDKELAGIVRRNPSPSDFGKDTPVVAHVSELKEVDAALVCVPPEAALGTVKDLLQARIPVVECARFHGDDFLRHKTEMHRIAQHHKVAAVVGAGCDPGIFSLFRGYFALISPHGHTETSLHTSASLHHTLAAEGIKGVKKALATELKSLEGMSQRYVYVELEPEADVAEVERLIAADPLFLDEQTMVFPVPSIADLEDSNRGLLLERRGKPGETGHCSFLLEARFDETSLAARVMLAATHALPVLSPGAYSSLDLSLHSLWGRQGLDEEKKWM